MRNSKRIPVAQAIDIIKATYPADSDQPHRGLIGRKLLETAVFDLWAENWLTLEGDILRRYAALCQAEQDRRAVDFDRSVSKKPLATSPPGWIGRPGRVAGLTGKQEQTVAKWWASANMLPKRIDESAEWISIGDKLEGAAIFATTSWEKEAFGFLSYIAWHLADIANEKASQ